MKINLKVARQIKDVNGMFCQNCGETNPKNGFYPMSISNNTSLSSLLCNDCDVLLRKKFKKI